MREFRFAMTSRDVMNVELELGMSLMKYSALHDQILNCNVCKINQGTVCEFCTIALEAMKGSKYPELDTKKIRKERQITIDRLRFNGKK